MTIDNKLLDDLLAEAEASPRRRMNCDLRNSELDGSQRMLNALLPGTQMPIHRHRNSSETVLLLRGAMEEVFFNDNGVECGRVLLDKDNVYGINIPKGQWHTVVVHEPSVIMEVKDGPYEPLSAEDVWNYE